MSEIKRYQQKTSLSTESPSVLASPEAFSASGRAISHVGEALGTIADELTKAQEFAQKTTAVNQAKMSISQIVARADADPDPNHIESYAKEISDAHKMAGQGITLRHAQDAFKLEFQSEANDGLIKLNSFKRKKIVDQGLAGLHQGLNQFTTDFINADPVQEDTVLQQTDALILSGYSHGFITAKEAVDIKQRHFERVGIEKANSALNNVQTTDQATAVKEAISNGLFEEHTDSNGNIALKGVSIDESKKRVLLNNADSKIKQIQAKETYAERMQREKDTHEVIDLSNNGMLSGGHLEELFLTKRIANSTYEKLQDRIYSSVGPTAGTDPKTYYDLTHYLLSETSDLNTARERILQANTDGKLSMEDAKKIYEMHLIPSKNEPVSLEDSMATQSGDDFSKMKQLFDAHKKALEDKKKWWKGAFDTFNSFFKGEERKVTEATQTLVDNINKNKIENKNIPVEADKIIGQENLKKHPEWAKLPEKGMPASDRFSPKDANGQPIKDLTVYPDGRVVRDK